MPEFLVSSSSSSTSSASTSSSSTSSSTSSSSTSSSSVGRGRRAGGGLARRRKGSSALRLTALPLAVLAVVAAAPVGLAFGPGGQWGQPDRSGYGGRAGAAHPVGWVRPVDGGGTPAAGSRGSAAGAARKQVVRRDRPSQSTRRAPAAPSVVNPAPVKVPAVAPPAVAPPAVAPPAVAPPAVPGGGAATGPSGLAAPRGDLPGWRQVFVDDFAGSALGDTWGWPYDDGSRKASHAVVGNGVLSLQTFKENGKWAGAGVSAWPQARTYGKYEVRFRVDKSDDMFYAVLLWPTEGWPPEVDIAEDAGGDRSESTATVHFGRDNRRIQHGVKADFSTWHTIGVEWTAGRLAYTLDGKVYATVTGSSVPSVPMWLGIQAEAGGCSLGYVSCPFVGTPAKAALEVDWVAVYAPK